MPASGLGDAPRIIEHWLDPPGRARRRRRGGYACVRAAQAARGRARSVSSPEGRALGSRACVSRLRSSRHLLTVIRHLEFPARAAVPPGIERDRRLAVDACEFVQAAAEWPVTVNRPGPLAMLMRALPGDRLLEAGTALGADPCRHHVVSTSPGTSSSSASMTML